MNGAHGQVAGNTGPIDPAAQDQYVERLIAQRSMAAPRLSGENGGLSGNLMRPSVGGMLSKQLRRPPVLARSATVSNGARSAAHGLSGGIHQ
jgi:hypothetical protein